MTDSIPILSLSDSSEGFAQILNQLVYLLNESEPLFYLRSLNRPDYPSRNINRLLLTAAILKSSGYVGGDGQMVEEAQQSDSYSSVFYYAQQQEFTLRNNEAFKAAWQYSSTGNWSYVVR